MLFPFVFPQIAFGGEQFVADITLKLHIAVEVCPMLGQGITVLILLEANVALKIFRLSVEIFVLNKVVQAGESLITF